MDFLATLTLTGARGAVASPPPPLIVVVDDDDDIREALTLALADAGYRVRGVSAWGALDLARRECPALMVMDVLMPGLNGPSLCRLLRERHGAGLPVIFISALPGFLAAPLAIDCAPWDFVAKPFDLDQLLVAIRRQLPAA